ncbi:MAG: FeoB-associated Cys-rich membrane protein [Kiritimatiellia bacterium]
MDVGSILVLVLIFGLVGLALWRVRKKGTPCLCDDSCKGECPGCRHR